METLFVRKSIYYSDGPKKPTGTHESGGINTDQHYYLTKLLGYY